jgi:hypothetical protein
MRMTKLADEFLAPPRILHPWPNVRDEPDPVITLGMRGEPVFGGSFGVGGADPVEPSPADPVERQAGCRLV